MAKIINRNQAKALKRKAEEARDKRPFRIIIPKRLNLSTIYSQIRKEAKNCQSGLVIHGTYTNNKEILTRFRAKLRKLGYTVNGNELLYGEVSMYIGWDKEN